MRIEMDIIDQWWLIDDYVALILLPYVLRIIMLDFRNSYKKQQYKGTTFQVLNTVQMAIDFPKRLSIFCSRGVTT